jgi:nitrite reductase/ring-hydroxylating ferredoxin subunit/uncharacterized membrane protein
MLAQQLEQLVKRLPQLKPLGIKLSRGIHRAILAGGEATRSGADVLHGTWLGHPLHAVLTDATIGAWTFGMLFDALSLPTRSKSMRQAGDRLTKMGTIAALPTALAGITDYSAIKQEAVAHGTLHGLLNSAALLLYISSVRERTNDHRLWGILFASAGYSVATLSAWLGGEMVYRLRVGVNHNDTPVEKVHWQPALADEDLLEGQPRRVEIEGQAVLIYRFNDTIYAIGAVCSHAGGPLEQGTFYEGCVQCPWHDSVYDLRDGHVVHGPSTYDQPRYQTRTRNGMIEVASDAAEGRKEPETAPTRVLT